MMWTRLVVATLCTLCLVGAACAGVRSQARTASLDCPATPLARQAPPDANTARLTSTWYTDGTLWAGPVPPYRGQWYAGPQGMKVGWWRCTSGRFSIEGRRLDGPAPPLRATVLDGYGDIGFQSTEIAFPTEGCWEITARVGTLSSGAAGPAHTFRLIARVQPAAEHPLATPATPATPATSAPRS